jgi:hypothetical protein
MLTTKRPTGLGTAAPDYETLVQQAINKVTGFGELYKELEKQTKKLYSPTQDASLTSMASGVKTSSNILCIIQASS